MSISYATFDAAKTAARLFDDVAAFSADTAGVSRPAFSPTETQTLQYLENYARGQGLCVNYDAGKNAVFSLPEDADANKFILVGSHVDSVPNGGNYDGLAGVVAGLLCLARAKNEGIGFAKPVKVIALRAEESAWFGPCYIASKALLGQLADSELSAVHQGDGRNLGAHMSEIGINMNRVRQHKPLMDPDNIERYIELHIEQGPLLIEKNLPAAVVSGIRGNIRYKKIRCVGEAGHSGAVPRAYRKDPVLAMADLLTRLDESWLAILQKGEDLVLTSGMVSTDPAKHALTRIPDQVDFSLDFRSQSADALEAMRDLLRDEIRSVERERGVKFELDPELYTAPALCDEKMVDALSNSMAKVNLKPFSMPSGGGHDAAVFANAGIPSAMVFVRNRNGSHNPDEVMEIPDLIAGTNIIFEYLIEAAL
ncbi:Zn-dependent hydrolase [Labrenzia sp. CE80]|uniref:Zn-dependent hydrolase n=1 Tax=Labrenzia sp. CE80 TaxID=1788986 RepID=UPI00129AE250|nr:Zn-dependent hydrolase [Labrenzia sp. CE80]